MPNSGSPGWVWRHPVGFSAIVSISAQLQILQYVPPELLNNPDPIAVGAFLRRKVRTLSRLRTAMIVAFAMYFIPLYIFDLLPLILFAGLAVVFHIQRKWFSLTQPE